ncbi:hypothetical protein CYFUS_006591 [Cystobacter fuscus]|uniref:Uncharacterized protein n=1 Tax=Cystobacter fuscus TaxID=43 RepID=A0A250JB44_9BACT|nr:hypothetical protein [Cystobacter fuscus]ATB41129.1 hypothetical protein CYFUS_006591 [Cystobacter fuscus]
MSTPPAPTPTESRPSPWLIMAVPIVVTLLGHAAQWGTLGADVRHLERRCTTTEAEVARVSSAQASAATQSARIEARLDGMERELSRLTNAVERLVAARSATARDVP